MILLYHAIICYHGYHLYHVYHTFLGPPQLTAAKSSAFKIQKLQRWHAQRCLQVGDCLDYHRDLAQKKKVHWHHFWLPNGATSIHFGFVGWNRWRNSWTAGGRFGNVAQAHPPANSPRHRRFCCPRHQRRLSKSTPPGGRDTHHGVLSQFVGPCWSCTLWAERGWKVGNGLFFLAFLTMPGSSRPDQLLIPSNPTDEFRPHLAAFRILLELLHLVSTGMDRNHMGLRSRTVSGSYGGWFCCQPMMMTSTTWNYLLEVPECPRLQDTIISGALVFSVQVWMSVSTRATVNGMP